MCSIISSPTNPLNNLFYFHLLRWKSTKMRLYPPSRGKYPLGVGPSGGALSRKQQTKQSTQHKGTHCGGTQGITYIPSRELTYPPDKAYLKMIFLFPRWDMLNSWRVIDLLATTITMGSYFCITCCEFGMFIFSRLELPTCDFENY